MSKTRKTSILEHWFGIDKILFGENAKNSLSGEDYDRYCTTKGALLSNLHEIYKKMDYDPETTYQNVGEMAKASIATADTAMSKAKKIIQTESVSKIVKQEIQEAGNLEGLSEQEVARYVVLKRRNAVAMDAMLMGAPSLSEGKDSLEDWQGKVLVDAHKTLRDALIDFSI